MGHEGKTRHMGQAQRLILSRAALFGLLLTMLGTVAPAEDFDLARHNVDGGGGFAAGDDFELSGTIGQLDAGEMVGGDFRLTGGFWFETPRGDCNFDGCTDLIEFVSFASCLAGPGTELEAGCHCFDVDNDGDSDLRDFARFQVSFNKHE